MTNNVKELQLSKKRIKLIEYFRSKSNSCRALIAYLGKTSFVLNKQKTDEAGRILILHVELDGDHYILINLYNSNSETEQYTIFNKLQSFFFLTSIKIKEFAGDFNFFF